GKPYEALARSETLKALGATDARLKETAWWIAGRHPDWGPRLSGFLRERLVEAKSSPAEREDLLHQLTRLAKSPAIQGLLADQVASGASPEARRLALQAMAQAGIKKAPAEWFTAIEKALPNMTAE